MRILEGTSVDGPGLRTSIYFAGCAHRCPGCHNPQTWDFAAGEEKSVEEVMTIINYNRFNVTFSGGDPIYQAEAIIPLAKAIKDAGYTLWCYTGFTYEELLEHPTPAVAQLLQYIDYLVEGPYIESLRNTELTFRGSSNQRIIEVATARICDFDTHRGIFSYSNKI